MGWNDHKGFREFGQRNSSQVYLARPGAYALLINADGRIGVLDTPHGCFLSGGGSEGSETPEETLVREVREECGFEVQSLNRIGEAIEYVFTPGNDTGIRKECVFFTANVGEVQGAASEVDHILIWLGPQEAKARLVHESQKWAVDQSNQIELKQK